MIDIRRRSVFEQFPAYAEQMAEFLGQQLGLYHELIDTVRSFRRAERQLKDNARINNQAFADWQHQVRSPINAAYVRLRDAMRFEFSDHELIPQYLKVQRGLLGKARHASRSLRLYLDLAKRQSLQLVLSRIESSSLTKLLVETCLDNRALASKRRSVDFEVRAESFSVLEAGSLWADEELLEQAVSNVIDNAFKYSYVRTKIQVIGSSMGGFFCLSVSNEGIPLRDRDVVNIGNRGWRGEEAVGAVGEGSGIGLWVVDHIMKAHLGRLEALPTTQGRTEVRLLFPWK